MNGQIGSDRSEKPAKTAQLDEDELVQSAKQGDERAIGELYRRHVDTIYRYVYTRVQDVATAEDLTAQVFLKALEGLPRYQAVGRPFLAWLYRIASARTVDYWRRQQRRKEVSLIDPPFSGGPQPAEALDAEGEWIVAIDLLAQLTDDQQDVMILRFIGEMKLNEVAGVLGKTTGAVKAIQHRALASLARLQNRQATSHAKR